MRACLESLLKSKISGQIRSKYTCTYHSFSLAFRFSLRDSRQALRNLFFSKVSLTSIFAILVGCGGGAAESQSPKMVSKDSVSTLSETKVEPNVPAGPSLTEGQTKIFDDLVRTIQENDSTHKWDVSSCEKTIALAREAGKWSAEGSYNSALVFMRCNQPSEAKSFFNQSLKMDGAFYFSKARLILMDVETFKGASFDEAIEKFKQIALVEAQYKSAELLTNLAAMYMKRQNRVSDSDGANDFERAKAFLQRALAVDDAYMPAYNQLALYYLESAREKGKDRKGKEAGKSSRLDPQLLDLAMLVCSQGLRKGQSYAPIHNTMGILLKEEGLLGAAISQFEAARTIDPGLFEAHVNFASINLQFRGFLKAEEAYRQAIKIHPKDYDSHLGLALALRGQMNLTNEASLIQAVIAEIEVAKQIDPNRPEAYFNQGILFQEYKSGLKGVNVEETLNEAKVLFQTFIAKAGNDQKFSNDLKRTQNRLKDIDQLIQFSRQSESERKAQEAERKLNEAKEELKDTP